MVYEQTLRQSSYRLFSTGSNKIRAHNMEQVMMTGGSEVSIFELQSTITRLQPIGEVNFKMAENLLTFILSLNKDWKNSEESYLLTAQMKLTNKLLSQFNFDSDRFLAQLSPEKGQMRLEELFTGLGHTFRLFFSIEEQIAVRNKIFPDFTDENPSDSRKRQIGLG